MAYERKLLGSTYQELVRIQGTEQIVSGGRKLRFNPEKLKKAALLDQLGREITNGEAPAPEKLALQYRQISLDTGPIVFDGGVPVGRVRQWRTIPKWSMELFWSFPRFWISQLRCGNGRRR